MSSWSEHPLVDSTTSDVTPSSSILGTTPDWASSPSSISRPPPSLRAPPSLSSSSSSTLPPTGDVLLRTLSEDEAAIPQILRGRRPFLSSSLLFPHDVVRSILLEEDEKRLLALEQVKNTLLSHDPSGAREGFYHLSVCHRLSFCNPLEDVREVFFGILNVLSEDINFPIPFSWYRPSRFLVVDYHSPVIVSSWNPRKNSISELESFGVSTSINIDGNELMQPLGYTFDGRDDSTISRIPSTDANMDSDLFMDLHEEAQALAVSTFLETGRLTNLNRILLYHPTYYDSLRTTSRIVMKSPGPLPLHWRDMLSIIAAARHNCDYLIRFFEEEYLANDGDPTWLNGVEHLPVKLRLILQLNALLAHRPWKINKLHMETLMQGTDAPFPVTKSDLWNLGELVHALTIFSHVHALCSIVGGCGVLPESDFTPLISRRLTESLISYTSSLGLDMDSSSTREIIAGGRQFLIEGRPEETEVSDLLTLMSPPETDFGSTDESVAQDGLFSSQTEDILRKLEGDILSSKAPLDKSAKSREFEKAGLLEDNDMSDLPSANRVFLDSTGLDSYSLDRLTLYDDQTAKFIGPHVLSYDDFEYRVEKVFRVADYDWSDHAFSLLSRFYPEIADQLDNQFTLIQELTYHSFHKRADVNTEPFRSAIWYYIHRIYGIEHDDYEYQLVNYYLNRPFKSFAKKVACYPERVTPLDFVNVGYKLLPEEKFHIAILSAEARKQAALIFAMYALDQARKQHSF